MSQLPIFNSPLEAFYYEHQRWEQYGKDQGQPEPKLEDFTSPFRYAPTTATSSTTPETVPMSQVKPPFDPRAMGTPNRGTSEASLDDWNRAMRSSDVYLNFMRRNGLPTDGRVKLSRGQQAALERELAAAGFNVPGGMHIDQGGNLNQKNRTGRNVAIGAAATGAALTGFGLAGMGPLSGLAGGSAAAGGAAGAAGLPAGMLPGGAMASTAFPTAAGFGAAAGGGAATALLPSTGAAITGPGAYGLASTVPMVTPAAASAMAANGASLWPTAANVVRNVSGGGNDRAGGNGLFRASDLVRYGIPAATSLVTGYMGNRASSNASTAALDEQRRQFDATQAWLREQEANAERRHKEVEDEKRRQFDAVEAEKRRKWDYGEPWREASRGALTRMSDLMNRGPERVAYQPTFYYRP